MKAKAFIVYISLGIAFAAVSLWVIFSKGKNAKAIRTKYKLGGAMIAAWVLLSATNCEGPGMFVSCYDPIPPENEIGVVAKDQNAATLKCGDVLSVTVLSPTYKEYRITLTTKDNESRLLQEETLIPDAEEFDKYVFTFEITLAETDYKGPVAVKVYGIDEEKGNVFVGEDTIELH